MLWLIYGCIYKCCDAFKTHSWMSWLIDDCCVAFMNAFVNVVTHLWIYECNYINVVTHLWMHLQMSWLIQTHLWLSNVVIQKLVHKLMYKFRDSFKLMCDCRKSTHSNSWLSNVVTRSNLWLSYVWMSHSNAFLNVVTHSDSHTCRTSFKTHLWLSNVVTKRLF